MKAEEKIFLYNEVIKQVGTLQQEDKTVVMSLGVFDIIHPGIIQHLTEAKKMGDILVVAVIRDRDVKRGPGRPVFNDEFRVQNVAALDAVDMVCIVDNDTPFECVKRIKPDIFAKGQAYHKRDRKIHEDIFKQERELYLGKSRIKETCGFSFSSSSIINDFLDIYPDDTKKFIQKFSEKYSLDTIFDMINDLKSLNILLIGDGIIDEYHYVSPMGKSSKAHLVVSKYISHEIFAGGAFAIANHLAGICNEVHLVSLLGLADTREAFITENLKPNVKSKFFYRNDGPSIIKKRYVDQYLNQKLFEINYMNDQLIGTDREPEIISYLSEKIGEYDLVLVSDFGHGFVSKNIIEAIQKYANVVAVNTQTNSANMGFNMITRYQSPGIVCLDEAEARLTMQNRFDDIGIVAKQLHEVLDTQTLVVTLGKKGSVGISRGEAPHYTPIFSSKIVDTVGAGDAVFSYVAPCYARGYPLDFITFIGNAVGALAVQIVCNKRSVERCDLFEFLDAMFKQKPKST
jgi:rfaE bifunctional protein nucleotidyltransferase chain/domain